MYIRIIATVKSIDCFIVEPLMKKDGIECSIVDDFFVIRVLQLEGNATEVKAAVCGKYLFDQLY